jgi:hypothetical protein
MPNQSTGDVGLQSPSQSRRSFPLAAIHAHLTAPAAALIPRRNPAGSVRTPCSTSVIDWLRFEQPHCASRCGGRGGTGFRLPLAHYLKSSRQLQAASSGACGARKESS